MPFDSTSVIDNPKPDDPNRGPESVGGTIAVLVRARAFIADERYWCRGAFARSWANIPVLPHSIFARRFCAVGALKLAATELLLPTQNTYISLEAQARRRVEGWNDDPKRTHIEVLALFDAAIEAL